MNVSTIVKSVATSPLGRKVVMNAPKILFGIGVASTVGAVGASIVGGIKAADVIDEAHEKIEEIHETPYEEGHSDKAESKELLKVYAKTGGEMIKIFWPTIVLTTVAIGCFTKSTIILNQRNAALVAAYNGLDKAFKLYRGRVIDAEGEEKDREYYLGAYETTKEIERVDEETGEITKETVTYEELPWEDMNGDPYTIILDDRSAIWSRNPDSTLHNLKMVQELAEHKLRTQGSLFLNEVREMLDVPRTKSGAALGWVLEEDKEKCRTSNYIDLGVFYKNVANGTYVDKYDRGYRTKVDEILDGGANPIVLHVNPDGIVYDLMK